MNSPRSASLWLLFITFLWGLSFVIVKEALEQCGPYWFLFLRFTLAALAALLFFRGVWSGAHRLAFLYGAVLSGVLYAGFLLQTLGLQFTSPSKSAFITGVSVILVPILGWMFFQARISLEVGLGVLTAFIGLYLLVRPDNLLEVNRGDLLTLGCAVVFAFHLLFVGRYAHSAAPGLLAVLQLGGAALLSLPISLAVETPRLDFSASFYVALVYLAVFCSALAFSVQIRAQRHVSPARAALIFSLEPVFAAMTSVIFYGDKLLWREWLGGALVMAGVLLGEASVLRSKCGTGRDFQRINQSQKELLK
ncbi:MAG: DMT family transporter [Acidobacteria bacterium]|nr:MAG: DMT family transporter [Acidobacteriota bacterium]